MPILPIIILIRVVMYLYNRFSDETSGPSRVNEPPGPWFIVIFWVLWTIPTVLINNVDNVLIKLIYIPTFLFCFPSWFATLSIKLGWVKISYWLGRSALATHRRDSFGGGLFYGWCALQNVKPEKKENLHYWLEQQLFKHKKVLRSGAMIMQVLLKNNKIADAKIMEMLRLLDGCNKKLISGNIARYTFRFMLARDLPTSDWSIISDTTRQWNDGFLNPLASWLLEVYWSKLAGNKRKSRFTILFKYLSAGMPKIAKHLPAYEFTTIAPSLRDKTNKTTTLADLKLAEWWIAHNKNSNAEQLNQYWQDYLNSDNHTKWRSRIQQLGSYNADEGFQKLEQSIKDVISYRHGADALASDVVSQEKDKNFALLKIKIGAVNQRLSNKKLMTGVQEFEEWFSIALIAKKLNADAMSHSQVYYILRSTCWNWVVELWNNADNKPLGYLICSFLSPMAYELSDSDASHFFSGIISNRFK